MGKEERLILNTADGKRIYGALNHAKENVQAKKLVILMHGMGRNTLYDALHVEARRFFNTKGYDVCRFNFYDARFEARQMHESTLQTHLDDMAQVLRDIATDYDEVYLCGHSYGGLLMMILNSHKQFPNIVAQALWDGGHGLGDRLAVIDGRMAKPYPEYGLFGYDYGVKLMVPEHFLTERNQFTVAYCNGLATQCTLPTLVATASESFLVQGGEEYFEHLAGKKHYVCIEGAAHFFAEDDTALTLYAETHNWFKKYNKG